VTVIDSAETHQLIIGDSHRPSVLPAVGPAMKGQAKIPR
jgi:hypothetical protein